MTFVDIEHHGEVLLIRMNRPERLNAMGRDMLIELAAAWTQFQEARDLKIAILTGTGKAFCAGEDLKEAAERGTPGLAPDLPHDPFWAGELEKPVIAAVNGWAMGGGYIMAHRADFRVACPEAVFEISEARHWLVGAFSFGFTETLPQAIASELALGFPFTAQRAYELGFLNRLVPNDDVVPEAFRMAEHLLGLPPASLVNTITVCHRLRPRIPTEIEQLANRLRSNGAVEDIMESRRAFAEKRRPVFKGF